VEKINLVWPAYGGDRPYCPSPGSATGLLRRFLHATFWYDSFHKVWTRVPSDSQLSTAIESICSSSAPDLCMGLAPYLGPHSYIKIYTLKFCILKCYKIMQTNAKKSPVSSSHYQWIFPACVVVTFWNKYINSKHTKTCYSITSRENRDLNEKILWFSYFMLRELLYWK